MRFDKWCRYRYNRSKFHSSVEVAGMEEQKTEIQSSKRRPFWTVAELSEAAGVSTGYVRRLVRAGEIQGGYKVGRAWVVPSWAAEVWLEGQR